METNPDHPLGEVFQRERLGMITWAKVCSRCEQDIYIAYDGSIHYQLGHYLTCRNFKKPVSTSVPNPTRKFGKKQPIAYFLTFTVDPKKGDGKMKDSIRKSLSRKTVEFLAGTIEHKDTNKHVHVRIKNPVSNARYQVKNFGYYIRNVGNVDIRPIYVDNGIDEYMSKETKVYYSLSDLLADL